MNRGCIPFSGRDSSTSVPNHCGIPDRKSRDVAAQSWLRQMAATFDATAEEGWYDSVRIYRTYVRNRKSDSDARVLDRRAGPGSFEMMMMSMMAIRSNYGDCHEWMIIIINNDQEHQTVSLPSKMLGRSRAAIPIRPAVDGGILLLRQTIWPRMARVLPTGTPLWRQRAADSDPLLQQALSRLVMVQDTVVSRRQ